MVRIACVGCGNIMEEHYRHLSRMADVKLVGHCDVSKERAEAASIRYGGKPFADHETMFDEVKPHAVYIAVPPYGHTGIEEAAAERGIHFFVEAPLALDRPTAKRIAAAVRKARIITSVGYYHRYFETAPQARRILKHKAVSLVQGAYTCSMPEVWWWRRKDKSGGQVLNHGAHVLDLVRYLCGEIAEVYAVGAVGCMTNVEDYDIHDSTVVSVRLKNGASGSIASSCVANHGAKMTLDIFSPEANVKFTQGRLTVTENNTRTRVEPQVNVFEEESKAFIGAVAGGKKNRVRSTYADALKTFLAACAASESIRSGMPVKP